MAKIKIDKLEIETGDEMFKELLGQLAISELAECVLADFARQLNNLGARLDYKLDKILTKEKNMAHTLDELVAKVQEQTTLAQSVATFIQQLKDALTAQGLDQTKIDAAFSTVEGNDQVLADAIVANTPAE